MTERPSEEQIVQRAAIERASRLRSSRAVWDVFEGEDAASLLIQASSSGNVAELRNLLAQAHWISVAFEKQVCIMATNVAERTSGEREIDKHEIGNLDRASIIATRNGHPKALLMLLEFALQQGVKPSSTIHRFHLKPAIVNGDVAVMEALATAWPGVVNFYCLSHEGPMPLDLAIASNQIEMVARLLELGAEPASLDPASRGSNVKRRILNGGHYASLLSRAAKTDGTRITELLLKHGQRIPGSGALHSAAQYGALDTIRLLLQRGADVNELLVEEKMSGRDPSLCATWTPMHFAASQGQVDAIHILESNGAAPDVRDNNGMTPAQLLAASKSNHP
jgi:ankyrin repeat protein